MKPSTSTTIAIIIVFAGYTVASYGVVLLRGYDIRWSRWINPLNPWSWPKGQVPRTLPTMVFPGQAAAGEASGGPILQAT